MALPRHIKPVSQDELERMTVPRLLVYRKKMLALENCLVGSDYENLREQFDHAFVYFKEDSRWQATYQLVLAELFRKQK